MGQKLFPFAKEVMSLAVLSTYMMGALRREIIKLYR